MNAFRFRPKYVEPDIDFLPPERPYRPMPRPGFRRAEDVSEAKFVTVGDPVGALRSRIQAEMKTPYRPQAPAAQGVLHALVNYTVRHVVRLENRLGQLSERSFTSLIAALAVLMFFSAGGFCLIGGTEAVPARNPLDITHVSLTPQTAGGMPVLLVNAIVENHAATTQALPDIRADLYSDGRLIASTLITPPAAEIGVGHSRGIAARLRHPGGKNPELKLSFAPKDASQS
ncbi:DUF3426 domain-containing protein [Agrobacterium vitis]|uniref:DUF3426 domain-containing protein n=1 Tax=Agrobacterium vitis TaxID=373 RepID=UPI002033D56D|nr:DUF3426 domain-containing protein [Agrobacterium vitis]MCM2448602.1 DUF3426 domain-containing protein [Agrobacterium vitis]